MGLGSELSDYLILKWCVLNAHVRYSDVGLLILKFCCMCNKAEYNYVYIIIFCFIAHHDDVKGPQHYTNHLKITFFGAIVVQF